MEMEQIKINGINCHVPQGSLLSEALGERGGFKLPCGGRGQCGNCKVHATGGLSEMDEAEQRLLTEEEVAEGIRLACRARILGAVEVDFNVGENAQLLPTGQESAAGKKPLFRRLGAAVDVGTTTLAGQLYDETGLLSQVGSDNPQAAFGADVISRIEKSLKGEGEALAKSVRQGISDLLIKLCEEAGCDVKEIDALVITGNTVMLYLLTGRNPECLSRSPFAADWLAGEWTTGEELKLPCVQARIWLPHCISAFVGADITSALLAVDIRRGENNRMLVDIGTNGEIALWINGEIFCCSTAAGPAFEGAGLSMGMQGETGAISHVRYTGEETFAVEVIGDRDPKGICGSGVVDAVSCLLESGRLDDTGYLEEEMAVIAGDVSLSQEDIRKVQLAKSAICAGMETMLYKAGLTIEQLEELMIAGGFGSFLDLKSAGRIGLLPREKPKKTTVCGNAALQGAARILLDQDMLEETGAIAACAKALNLATDSYFYDRYIEGMSFYTVWSADGSFER